jgi:hypothetical protein
MTMHLVRGLSSTSSRKKRKAPSKGQIARWQIWHREHNAHLKRIGLPVISFEQYLDQLHGKVPEKKQKAKPLQVASLSGCVSDHRVRYPSLNSMDGNTTRKEPQKYTGDRLLGIATMHKSNLVPVFSAEDAVELARMRR